MRPRRAHPAICLVVLGAYLLNLVFVAGGAVLCRDSEFQARLKIAYDHGQCDTAVQVDHDHESSESCWCSACSCEDTPLGITLIATLNRNVDHETLASSCDCVPWYEELVKPPSAHAAFATLPRAPPGVAEQLRHLRTIVLIV